MAVDIEISRQHIREEIALLKGMATLYKWGIIPDYGRLTVLATMYACTGDLYIIEIRCDDYKERPPFFEFIDPDSGVPGTTHAYPARGTDSFFHNSGPCICAPFNRKAYKSVVSTGPHDDWNLGDWQTSTASGVQWANYSKLGDMLGAIQTRINHPGLYKGRME